ncbi:hypothetical protein QYM36_018951 [Artemia franciscana]|uniref:NFX1-type zinc finger-containing protein 1 n=1 Tax=Artemia franciscana TaxID=6661 RepID=A0AA88H5X8_ARTSF|nr:hypothetical protein QYM36_018951 [Artemia franciscana]
MKRGARSRGSNFSGRGIGRGHDGTGRSRQNVMLNRGSSLPSRGVGRGALPAFNRRREFPKATIQDVEINPNRRFTYEEMKILENLGASEILQALTSKRKDFASIMEKEMNFDRYSQAMKLLGIVCDSEVPDLHEHLFIELLMMVKHSGLLRLFNGFITQAVAAKKIENDKLVQLHIDLVKFSQKFLDKTPTSACESIPECFFEMVIQLKMILQVNHYNIPESVYEEVRELNTHVETVRKCFVGSNDLEAEKKLRKLARAEEWSFMQPPDDFRSLSVVPTRDDILSPQKPFLRPAIVNSSYRSVDDYLDTHFRLLREDFIAPLRSGIQQYKKFKTENKHHRGRVDDLRLYFNVKFVEYDILQGTHLIHISTERLKNVVWENSKRLMHGSLLCLSKDDFCSFILATVVKRDPQLLEKEGTIHVRVEDLKDFKKYNSETFVMAESCVYFEVYRNVLRVLQQFKAETLPMEEIVLGKEAQGKLPLYLVNLKEEGKEVSYNLSMLSTSDDALLRNVDILRLEEVLSPEKLGFDRSQMQALKVALTQRLAIIQGPPGTGKTFIGLKVVQALLSNKQIWSVNKDSEEIQNPILIVCYTNHALDQFVEGILQFTKKAVRIGSRSKSEIVNDHSLYSLRTKSRENRVYVCNDAYHREKRSELKAVVEEVLVKDHLIHLVRRKVILHERYLSIAGCLSDEFLAIFEQQSKVR